MPFKAKTLNRLFLFFIVHQIVITTLFGLGIAHFGKQFDAYTQQTFAYLLVFVPAIALFFNIYPAKLHDYFFLNPLGPINAILSVIIALMSLPVLMFFSLLPALVFENTAAAALPRFFNMPLSLVLLVTAFMPAFFEEFVFRGIFLNKQIDMPLRKKILLSSFFFAAMHLSPQQFFYAFAGGILFSVLMYVTRSVFAPMTAHFTINALMTTLSYTAAQTDMAQSVRSQAAFSDSLLAVLVLFALTFPILIFAFYLLIINNKEKIAYEALIVSLKKITQIQNAALQAASAQDAQNGQSAEDDGAKDGEAPKKRGKNKQNDNTLTWEFWVVTIIYAAYSVFSYLVYKV